MPLLAYFHGHSRDSALARLLLPYHIPAMTAFSVLDLVPVIEGSDIVAALANAADLAAHAERLGYKRYWVAERSEEHTSELQSLMRISYAVFCLKKKHKHTNK